MADPNPVYGLEVGPSNYAYLSGGPRGVIARVEKSHTGNVILRAGNSSNGRTWEQSVHVVMVPEEARDLARSILAAADADGWNPNG